MKLVRHGDPGEECPGRLDAEGRVRDLTGVVDDIVGATICPDVLHMLRHVSDDRLPVIEPRRLGPCVSGVGKFICIGLNYADHAAEAGREMPAEPLLFMKATSATCGPDDDVERPLGANKLDYEVELGIVVGRRAKNVELRDAMAHVAGYCVVNDISERAFQSERGGQWTKGKSADTFGPIGPWLVTCDEIPDPRSLNLWLDVDDEPRQRGSTANMIFGIADLVSYISAFMTLEAGDVIATGTPSGVALGMRPQRFLEPGQNMRLGIEGLGVQTHRVVGA